MLSTEEAVAVNILDMMISARTEKKERNHNVTVPYHGNTDEELSTVGSEFDEEDQLMIHETIQKIQSICPKPLKDALGSKLNQIINSTLSKDITETSLKSLIKDNFNKKIFKSKKEKGFLLSIEKYLKAAAVYFLYLKSRSSDNNTSESFLDEYSQYPMFSSNSLDDDEIQYIVKFRDMLQIAMQVIPAARNKILLIRICAALEGSGRVYVTGGTQSLATSRRMQIFEHESGLQKTRRNVKKTALVKVPKPKEVVTCACGAVVLKRTVWKHSQSKKHVLFQLYGQLQLNSMDVVPPNSELIPPQFYSLTSIPSDSFE